MASEETPLLLDGSIPPVDFAAAKEHELVYNRFTPLQKRTIIALISVAGLSPLLISGSLYPSIPQIARDLDTTGSVVSLAVSVSIFANAAGSLLWATYSKHYGRRPVYLFSLFCQCLGSLGVATAQSVPQLLVWRVFQAFGAASGLSVGMGVIGDIYKLEERGAAAGIFFGAVLIGPALAPMIGGVMTHYYSWRVMQYGLLVFGILSFTLTYFLQPETSQPGARGVDKMLQANGKVSWVWLNPFGSLALLRSPNVLLLALAGGLVLLTDYFILVPIAFTLGAKYKISNEALIGALCIPLGVGNFIGAPLAGALSDRMVVKWRKKRGNQWVPEDRLRATIIGAVVFVPLSILLCGVFTTYVDGTLGLILNCFCLFMNGLGVDFVLSPSAAYNVDILHDHSAEVTAANMAFRNGFMSICVAFILPMINYLGILVTYIIVALVAWWGFVLIWLIIRYGGRMRAWIDVGYSTLKES